MERRRSSTGSDATEEARVESRLPVLCTISVVRRELRRPVQLPIPLASLSVDRKRGDGSRESRRRSGVGSIDPATPLGFHVVFLPGSTRGGGLDPGSRERGSQDGDPRASLSAFLADQRAGRQGNPPEPRRKILLVNGHARRTTRVCSFALVERPFSSCRVCCFTLNFTPSMLAIPFLSLTRFSCILLRRFS